MKRILVTTDNSSCAAEAFELAAYFQQAFDASLEIVSVFEGFGWESGASRPGELNPERSAHARTAEKQLERSFGERCPNVRVKGVAIAYEDGPAADIARYASVTGAQMVVIATHGRRGIRRLIAGSVTERLLQEVTCPVLIVPRWNQACLTDGHCQIAVATDLSPPSFAAFPIAREIYTALGDAAANLTLVHVSENIVAATYNIPLGGSVEEIRRDVEEMARLELDAIREQWFPKSMAMATVIRGKRPVDDEIAGFIESRGIDILIMASQGRSAVDRTMFGSVAQKMVRIAAKPVLVVPPSDSSPT